MRISDWSSDVCSSDLDLPFTLATVVIEALGSANMGFSLCSILTPGAIHALLAYGTEEQRQTWLPKLVTGEWNGTMNLTEPAAGSDVGALRSTAEKITEGPNAGLYNIRGQKILDRKSTRLNST